MKGQISFKIEGYEKQFVVKELTVRQIIELTKVGDLSKLTLAAAQKHLYSTILPKATNLKKGELLEMTPGELEIVWEKFKEVNKSFFRLLKKADLGEVINQFKAAFLQDFFATLARSSKPDTTKSLTTATAIST